MEENRNEMGMEAFEETTNVATEPVTDMEPSYPVNVTYMPPTEDSKRGSTGTKLACAAAGALVTVGIARGIKFLRKRNEQKTVERLRSQGWYVEGPNDGNYDNYDEPEDFYEEEPDAEPVPEKVSKMKTTKK